MVPNISPNNPPSEKDSPKTTIEFFIDVISLSSPFLIPSELKPNLSALSPNTNPSPNKITSSKLFLNTIQPLKFYFIIDLL